MKTRSLILPILLCASAMLAACGGNLEPPAEPTPTQDVVAGAAAQATALLQQAQATAIVLQAQAQATALVEQARQAGSTPASAVAHPQASASATPAPAGETASSPEPSSDGPTAEPMPAAVLSVGFAGDGGLIMVRFMASPDEAETWWQGDVTLTDEGSGAVYGEIPVMPKVGPLIARPSIEGQAGYVMLVNSPPYLQAGALVTVALGKNRFKHVPVE